MATWTDTFKRTILSATIASLTSTVVLALLARAAGKGALQPVNATSHWLNGEGAAAFEGVDAAHTAVGYTTHHAATIFWAFFFEAGRRNSPARDADGLLRQALIVSAIAAAVDYGPTPKRFTPGWEFVLSKRAMAVAYAAMAIGLAAGAEMTRPRLGRRTRPARLLVKDGRRVT